MITITNTRNDSGGFVFLTLDTISYIIGIYD
jgi:hypothetical protein